MTSQRIVVCLLAITALFMGLPTLSAAFVPPKSSLPISEIPLAPHSTSGPTGAQLECLDLLVARQPITVKFSDRTGTPRVVSGRLLAAKGTDEAHVARQAIDSLGELYAIRTGEDAFALVKTSRSHSYSHSVFEQQYNDIPVWRAGLAVHLDGAGVVRKINGEFYRGINCQTEPSLIGRDAEEIALSFVSPNDEIDLSIQQRLVIAPTEQFRLSYEVKVFCRDPLGLFVFLVDAQSGDVLYFKNELLFGRVTGNVYDVNPEKTPLSGMPIRDMKVSQSDVTYYSDADGYFDAEGEIIASLEGPYCTAINEDTSRASWRGDATFVWDYAPLSTHFDEVCVFYHVNLIHAWFKEYLEYDGMDIAIPVTVHYGDDMNNAMYSPSSNSIYLGDGTLKDPAHEADVVMHEYGHAVVHNTASADFANLTLNEGYADYFTCSLHDDPLLGEWWMPPYLRNLDNDLVYPFDLVGESHHDGQIWSGALWDIRSMFGAEVSDRIALGTLFYYGSPSPSFLDARDAALDADEEYFSSEHQDAIVEIFSRRGISEVAIASWALNEVEGNGNGNADPGETLELTVQMRNNLTDARIRPSYLLLSSESDDVQIIEGLAEVPMIDPYGKAEPASAFRFVISPDCPADSVIELDLRMGYGIGELIFAGSVKITLGSSPEITVLNHRIYDYIGNGDETPNPGELIVILPTVENTGDATAASVRMRTFVRSSYVNARGGYHALIYSDSGSFGDVGPDETVEGSASDDSIIQILESNTPDGYEYEVDYDIAESSGRKWTGSLTITVTGEDETPPWVAYSEASPRLLNQNGFFYVIALVIEPGKITALSGSLHNRDGDTLGSVDFYQYAEGLYMGFGTMPANEDVFLDITARDSNGNQGTKKNACAFGPPNFTPQCDILYVADDFADAGGTRSATLDALAAEGLSADIWETEIRKLPGKSTLNKYADGLAIFEAKYNPYYMSHYAYLAYRPTSVADAMELGVNVLLMGQLVGSYYDAYNEAGTFFEDTFSCEVAGNKENGQEFTIAGETGDIIGDGLSFNLVGTEELPITPDFLTPLSGCSPVVHFGDDESQKAGVRVETENSRGVYLTFGLSDVEGDENRQTLFSRTIDWLMGPGVPPCGVPIFAAGFGATDLTSAGGSFEMQAYTNPSYPFESIEIYFAGYPLGIYLDETSPDFYTVEMDIGALAPGQYTLELIGTLESSEQIVVWPYLPIGNTTGWVPGQREAYDPGVGLAASDAPKILVAGFCSTDLPADTPGLLHVVALINDPNGLSDIASVMMDCESAGLADIELFDDGANGDFGPGDGIYGAVVPDVGPLEPGLFPVSITAEDYDSNTGQWPSLVVGNE